MTGATVNVIGDVSLRLRYSARPCASWLIHPAENHPNAPRTDFAARNPGTSTLSPIGVSGRRYSPGCTVGSEANVLTVPGACSSSAQGDPAARSEDGAASTCVVSFSSTTGVSSWNETLSGASMTSRACSPLLAPSWRSGSARYPTLAPAFEASGQLAEMGLQPAGSETETRIRPSGSQPECLDYLGRQSGQAVTVEVPVLHLEPPIRPPINGVTVDDVC